MSAFHPPARPAGRAVIPRLMRTCTPAGWHGKRLAMLTVLCAAAAACRGPTARVVPAAGAPALLRGEFRDDYRGRFSISDSVWFQRPRNRFRILRWVPEEKYLIAHNAPDDPSAPGLFTRIDWMTFDGMAPYTWGFCLTEYRAVSREAAQRTSPARRDMPRTGCNGFPFTRMQRITPADTATSR